MSEDITIIFQPAAYKYFYDCVRIHCEEEILLIPIHAYPTLAKIDFPKNIKLGPCNVGDTVTKVVKLESSVPIQFEYDLKILQPNSQISISPMKGIIPANGSQDVIIKFTPLKMSTALCQLEVNTSQFNFSPTITYITGSVDAHMHRKKLLHGAITRSDSNLEQNIPQFNSNNNEGNQDDGSNDNENAMQINSDVINRLGNTELVGKIVKKYTSVNMETFTKMIPFETFSKSVTTQPVTSVNGIIDAAGDYKSLLSSQYKKKNELNNNDNTKPEVEIDGIKIPSQLNSVSALNYVLTQQKGKLKPKDLKIAIENARVERKRQKEIQDSLSSGHHDGEGVNMKIQYLVDEEKKCTIAGSSRQLRELAFLHEMQEIDLNEKKREFASKDDFIGQDVLTQEEVRVILDVRKDVLDTQNSNNRKIERSIMEIRASGINSNPPERSVSEIGYIPDTKPTYNMYKNDLWRKRSLVLQKFVNAASTIIIRKRVVDRLKLIITKLGGLNNRSDVRAFVDMENRLARVSGGGPSTSSNISPHSLTTTIAAVQSITFPEWIDTQLSTRNPVVTNTPKTFEDYNMFPTKLNQEYNLLGHKEILTPNFQYYFPLEEERCLRFGAFEEEGIRSYRGSDIELFNTTQSTSEEILTIQAPWLVEPPSTEPMEFILPTNDLRIFSAPLIYDESQSYYDVRPKNRIREVDSTLGEVSYIILI